MNGRNICLKTVTNNDAMRMRYVADLVIVCTGIFSGWRPHGSRVHA